MTTPQPAEIVAELQQVNPLLAELLATRILLRHMTQERDQLQQALRDTEMEQNVPSGEPPPPEVPPNAAIPQ